MSSSYRKALALVALLSTPAAWAQQWYVIPGAEVTGERHTNRELQPDSVDTEDSEVYKLTLEARLGRATPRSNTMLRPRIVAQELPDRDGEDRMEYFLNLNHEYRTLKGSLGFDARYSQQDTFNAEFGTPVDDGDPTTPPPPIDDESGIVIVGRTRKTAEATPSFQYSLTEKVGLGGNLQWKQVRYDTGSLVLQQNGFDNAQAELSVFHKFAPRTAWSVGPYYSHYEADEDSLVTGGSLETDTYGLRLALDHQWSEVSLVSVAVRGERNDTQCDCLVPIVSGESTEWGVEVVGVRRNPTGSIRYGVGRFLTPSTLGNRRQSDQIRLQYERLLSEKLGFRGAFALSRDETVGPTAIDGIERDRIRAELSLNRFLTPTWYVAGGYRYGWLDLGASDDTADNHAVFLSVGIKGRDPRQANR